VDAPETKYAKTVDGVYLAYQVAGEGSVDLACQLEYVGNVEDEWEEPLGAAWYRSLAGFSRLILHDRRGVGLSSRNVPPPNLETRAADLEVVLDAAGSERVALVGLFETGAPNVLFAASHPERVHSIVWIEPMARCTWAPDYPWGHPPEDLEAEQELLELWGTAEYGRAFAAEQAAGGNVFPDDQAAYVGKSTRHACTPDVAKQLARIWYETDVRGVLPAVQVPTLLLVHCEREGAVAEAEHIAALMPHAEVRKMPGEAWQVDEMPTWAEEVRAFIGAKRPTAGLDRVLAAVLFTDIVGSTQRLTEMGDAAWRSVLARHDERARAEIELHRGRYIDSTGDGLFATFDGPARAVLCAQAIGHAVADLGIRIRAGVHTGEVELEGDAVRGIAVHIGARVAALAGPSEVFVSQTVKDLVAGSGLIFDDAGEHELKGVPDRWHLYRVVK
jgi:class 3 adenylate cyclase/pimeloyl-ACP methyl ester carboxylesterase